MQQDFADCGVACMASLINYYGGSYSIERLRELSGASKEGVTLRGLYELANQIGFQAEGYTSSVAELRKTQIPVILHVLIQEKYYHYVVCYGYGKNRFIIHDPAYGLRQLHAEELEAIWVSKALLYPEVGNGFIRKATFVANQRKWIKSLIKDDIHIFSVALFLGVILAILNFSTAIYSQKLIDKILPSQDRQLLFLSLIVLSLLILFRLLLGYARGYLLTRQSMDFNIRMIRKFLSKLLSLPVLFFENRKTGDLIARLNDSLRIQSTISYLASTVIIDALSLIISLVIVFYYSSIVGAVALISIPVYVFLVLFFNNLIMKKQKDAMAAHSVNESQYIDTIQGIQEVQSSNKIRFFTQLTLNTFHIFQNKSFDLGKFSLRYSFISGAVGLVFTMTIIALSATMVLNNQLQLGEMVALLSIANGIIPLTSGLTSVNIEIQEARIAFKRMYDMNYYDEPQTTQGKVISTFEMLQANGLSFRYPGGANLLNKVSFTLKRGEMVALLGESGCGKSTLLKIINKFYKPPEGNILINGVNLQDVETDSLRKTVAVVSQNIKIFNASVIANICLGDPAREAENVVDFCRRHSFDQYFEKLPLGYLTTLGENGVKLSGGQAQLIALARALYRRPQVLLLDEATSAMDRRTESVMLNMLDKLSAEMAILLTTHKFLTAAKADRIYLLENNCISAAGSHEKLLQTDNFYSRYFKEIAEKASFA